MDAHGERYAGGIPHVRPPALGDYSNGRPSLPPMKMMDVDRYRMEEQDATSRLRASNTATSAPRLYPSGPPPPYSAATQISIPADHPTKRADAREFQEKALLPSLHEALGVERRGAYQKDTASTRALPSPQSHASDSAPRLAHVYTTTPAAPPPSIHAHQHPLPPRRPSEAYEQRRHDWSEHRPVTSTSSYRQRTPPSGLPHSLDRSPDRLTHSIPGTSRPWEASPQRASAFRPPSSFPYGYSPAAPSSATNTYNPSLSTPVSQYPESSSEASHAWRRSGHSLPEPHPTIGASPSSTSASATQPLQPPPQTPAAAPQPYGESVKRHLDLYDLEVSLNDISENSTVALDFAKSYGARMHQIQRSGIEPGVLPNITEVDALLKQTQHTMEALGKMREVLVAQHALHRQQAQEQAQRSEDIKRSDSVYQQQQQQQQEHEQHERLERHERHERHQQYEQHQQQQQQYQQQDEAKSGGFAGSEPKKRRSRNAAPGRCHSCNRAETPEWRRGPDGARTLCNACGLHYAKLTRKAGANKAAAAAGSGLRPKDESNDA